MPGGCDAPARKTMQNDEHLPDDDEFALTPDEELVDALCRGKTSEAACILRRIDGLGKVALDALADMLDGDPNKKPYLRRLWPSARSQAPSRRYPRSLTPRASMDAAIGFDWLSFLDAVNDAPFIRPDFFNNIRT